MMNRRNLLKFIGSGVAAVLVAPQMVWAMVRNGFDAKKVPVAIKQAFGSSATKNSNKVILTVPSIAENGAVVPVTVKTTLTNVEAIAILVEKNPSPLCATFQMNKNLKSEVSTRVKMRSSSNILAVVKADGKLYSMTKNVKVTLGGCGG